jgi:phosphoribosylformylglycinamidine synthase subunit PurL
MLLGRSRVELGGSLWARVAHRHLGGRPPAVDLTAERALAAVLGQAGQAGLLEAAHDLSDGGLAIALAECCLAGGQGCAVRLPGAPAGGEFPLLFGESAARAVVAVRPGAEAEFAALCQGGGVPAAELGVTGGASLEITGSFTVSLDELAAAHRGTLPALFG